MTPVNTSRIQSIDLLRGLVMIIMALDHVRDYTHHGYLFADPTNLDTTTPAIFFTRWITHFCAPVFVFLAGTSAFLYGTKRSTTKELSIFLFTRGLWLVLIELTVVTFGWTFDISFGVFIIQVIWAIGISMMLLSALIYLPKNILIVLGIILVAGHNLLDGITVQGNEPLSLLWYILHQSTFTSFNNGEVLVFFAYPLIPWVGLMILGYCLGSFYTKAYAPQQRQKWLLILGISATVLFLLLRFINVYGNLTPWSDQKNITLTILSFLNTTKYPPSLLYLLMTIGPSLLFLSFAENISNKLTKALVVIGRVPFFFYIIHIYIIHLIGVIGITLLGVDWKEFILTTKRFSSGYLSQYGYDLWVVYAVWIFVIILLYPICYKFMAYKANNKDKWWLSYL